MAKIRRNMERDREEQQKLAEMGWHCITIWECELKPKKREQTLNALENTLREIYLRDRHAPKLYDVDEYYDFELPMAAESSREGS